MGTTLDGIRVLDLTDHRGELAGRILADLGAEVVKIEPEGGVDSRRMPPFDKDGNSLFWACYGEGKKSIRLSFDDQRSMNLLEGADVLIESFSPGITTDLGIDQQTLRQRNPRLIYMSISAFGQTGPKAHWPATALTIEAAGGRVSLQGDPDRPPLPVGYPQAWLHAAAQAAADIVIALNGRDISGLGQHLDLSAQEAIWWTLMGAQGTPVCLGQDPPGVGNDRGDTAGSRPPGPRLAAAKDGLVTLAPGASPPGTHTLFSRAIDEAGVQAGELASIDWDNWIALARDGQISAEQIEQAWAWLRAWVARRTKLELVDLALVNNLRLGPLNSTRDLLDFPQYNQRGFYEHIGGIKQPARWAHLGRTPLIFSPAPGQPQTTAPDWPATHSTPEDDTGRTGDAFQGLKVADFSWVAAGPTIAKALADQGATVIKVESATRPDLSRTLPPHVDGQAGLNRSYWSFLYATSKLSLQCNLSTSGGRELARRVCDWADVVIESFSPGTMQRMGLDYETLSADHPDLIMLSTSMLGQTGPLARYAGYGQQAAAFCGLHYITGWPDREPCGVASPYTDVIAPKFGIAALAAAIFERRRSGKGQLIDLAQAECSQLFLGPLLLDESVNGRTAQAAGYDSMYASPQGIYPTLGTERYIAIAVETPEHWTALRRHLPAAFQDPAWEQARKRQQDRQAIHEAIARWTSACEPLDLEAQLVGEGIPASIVQRPTDVDKDPQIKARGLKERLEHSECGRVIHYGSCTRFSARRRMVRHAPPCIGEHNAYVLKQLLQLPDDQIKALEEQGVLE